MPIFHFSCCHVSRNKSSFSTSTMRRSFYSAARIRGLTYEFSRGSSLSASLSGHAIPFSTVSGSDHNNFPPPSSIAGATSPRYPQEALDQLYVLKSEEEPPPSFWLKFVEQFQKGKIPVEVEHQLLKKVTESENRSLLERATDQLEWTDPESLRMLVLAWTNIMKKPSRAAQILLNWPKNAASPPTLSTFRPVLVALSEEQNHDMASKLLQLLCEGHYPRIFPDRDCFHRVLSACGTEPRAAEETLSRMIQHSQSLGGDARILPNLTSYRLLFRSFAKSRKKETGEGIRAYELLQSCPLDPDIVCCNQVLNALANEGEFELAQELFLKMLWIPNFIDKITVYTVFKAHDRANTEQAATQAEFLLKGLDGMLELGKRSNNLNLPNTRIYATVIGLWARLGRINRAWRLLKELETRAEDNERFTPDAICYQAVIGCLSKANSHRKENAVKAQKLLETMVDRGFSLNLRTCNAVLKCWASAMNPKKAEELVLNKMANEWRVEPDIVSYNTVIGAHGRVGNVGRAQELLEQMKLSNATKPNTRTYIGVLTALSQQKTVDAAESAEMLLLQMQELHEEEGMDTRPNIFTYNAVLNCWTSQGNISRAEHLLRELECLDDIKPDVVSYNSLIHAYKNKVAKGELVVEKMLERNIEPNSWTLKALLKLLENDDSVSDKAAREQNIRLRFFS